MYHFRAFALISLAAACYPAPLSKENFDDTLGIYLHDVVGDLFTYACSLDAFFCTLSFVYKGIILEARMGTRRFFNLVCIIIEIISVILSPEVIMLNACSNSTPYCARYFC